MSDGPPTSSISLCPECGIEIPCQYEVRDDNVWQTKSCQTHGEFASLVWHGAKHWAQTAKLQTSDVAPNSAGAGGRKKCLAVIDVTRNCNLACSFCFASSKPGLADRPVVEIHADLETVLRQAGGPTPIQFSGGEPTVRGDLPELVKHAKGLGFTHIEINSNGIKLAQDPNLAAHLKEAGATTVYLQFDGFGRDLYTELRGMPELGELKLAAIENCRQAGLQIILVPTVVPGANDDQLGQIVEFALANIDVVRGVNFQPVSDFGRCKEETEHLSLPLVARKLAEQTSFIRANDLLQVPCCGPQCSSATMILNLPGKRLPLTRLVSRQAYQDVVAAFDEKKFMDLLSGLPAGVDAAKDAAGCCGIPVPPGLERFLPRMLALTVTGFMDIDNVDLTRLAQCCISVPVNGTLVPFCGYNLTTKDGQYRLREKYERHADMARGGLPMAQ